MSTGLLRGLAARALGLEVPLRSQRARGLDLLPTRPSADADPAPLQVPPPTWAAPLVDSHGAPGRTDTAEAAPPLSTTQAPDAALPVGPTGAASGPAPRRGTVRSRPAAADRAPVPAEPPGPGVARAAGTTTPRPEAPVTPASKAFEAPTMQTVPTTTPEPLLPLVVPIALPRPAAPVVAATLRRGPAQRAGSSEAPTEVHVSIGRVELTALAPTTSGRATARREAPAGRSLADYLRGGSPGGRKPT